MWPLFNKLHDKIIKKTWKPLNLWSFQFFKPKKLKFGLFKVLSFYSFSYSFLGFYNPSWQPWLLRTRPNIIFCLICNKTLIDKTTDLNTRNFLLRMLYIDCYSLLHFYSYVFSCACQLFLYKYKFMPMIDLRVGSWPGIWPDDAVNKGGRQSPKGTRTSWTEMTEPSCPTYSSRLQL